MNKKEIIFNDLRKLALVLGQDITAERLELVTAILANFDLKNVQFGIAKAATKFTFFPSPAQLLEIINPTESRADQNDFIAGEIISSIQRFGSYQAIDAKKYLGENAWRAVGYMGGWQAICGTNTESLGLLRAQIKKAINGSLVASQGDSLIDYTEFSKNLRFPTTRVLNA